MFLHKPVFWDPWCCCCEENTTHAPENTDFLTVIGFNNLMCEGTEARRGKWRNVFFLGNPFSKSDLSRFLPWLVNWWEMFIKIFARMSLLIIFFICENMQFFSICVTKWGEKAFKGIFFFFWETKVNKKKLPGRRNFHVFCQESFDFLQMQKKNKKMFLLKTL